MDNGEPVPGPSNERFVSHSEEDVSKFIFEQKNVRTLQKTDGHLKLLGAFLKQKTGVDAAIETFAPDDLNRHLADFFISVRKVDGEEYEPTTLRGMLASVERYLKDKQYGKSLITDPDFALAREALKSKQIDLKGKGKGNKPKRAEALTDDEIERLYDVGQLGTGTPRAILNTLWFQNTMHFGMRGTDEHHQMCWGDVSLKTDTAGNEYLEYNERKTKTRTGVNVRDVRPVPPRAYALPDNEGDDLQMCPVRLYKLYRDLRPQSYCEPFHPFYIATATVDPKIYKCQWFKRQPVGQQLLAGIMKTMADAAGLSRDKRLTNTSVRKHCIQKLSDFDVPPSVIVQKSGHKNIQSLNSYSTASENQQRRMSAILSRTFPTPAFGTFSLSLPGSGSGGVSDPIPPAITQFGERPAVPAVGPTAQPERQVQLRPHVPLQPVNFDRNVQVPAGMQSQTNSSVNKQLSYKALEGMVSHNVISGGTFNFHINARSPDLPPRKFRRVCRPLDSDSD